MSNCYVVGETLDDVLHLALNRILCTGGDIHPTKGPAKELVGVLLEITNPRARLSRTETKGKPFSCLGELLWYLAKSNQLSFIAYYLVHYNSYADGNVVYGGYGPRLFNWKGLNQFDSVASLLTRKRESRQAVLQLFDAADITEQHNDVPCTCTLQFMIRRGGLDMITHMRSNDAFIGLPHDVFCFTMLQEIMARTLSVELGTYKHMVGSLHLYRKDMRHAQQFLEEGWQSTTASMPPMPQGNPKAAIDCLLQAEEAIRTKQEFDANIMNNLDSYWADLVRLLQIFRSYKDKEPGKILEFGQSMSSDIYSPFINEKVRQLRGIYGK